jgi:hypothetical protein
MNEVFGNYLHPISKVDRIEEGDSISIKNAPSFKRMRDYLKDFLFFNPGIFCRMAFSDSSGMLKFDPFIHVHAAYPDSKIERLIFKNKIFNGIGWSKSSDGTIYDWDRELWTSPNGLYDAVRILGYFKSVAAVDRSKSTYRGVLIQFVSIVDPMYSENSIVVDSSNPPAVPVVVLGCTSEIGQFAVGRQGSSWEAPRPAKIGGVEKGIPEFIRRMKNWSNDPVGAFSTAGTKPMGSFIDREPRDVSGVPDEYKEVFISIGNDLLRSNLDERLI